MTMKELKEELIEIRYHIKNYSSGTYEYHYKRDLLEEIKNR
jgi:hypothetical protein